jgi:hypothetical protein
MFIFSMFLPVLQFVFRYVDEPGDGGGDGGDPGDGGGGDGGGDGGGGAAPQTRSMNPGGNAPAKESTPWYEQAGIDAEILTDKDKEYKSLADYVKGAQNARQLASSKGIALPGENATDEQKAAFKSEVMKHFPDLPITPESADQYDIPMFKDENVGLPEERQQEIKGAFHKAGLSNAHAAAVMDIYAEQVGRDMEEAQAQIEQQRKTSTAALKKEWGAEYDERMAGIARVQQRYPEMTEKMKTVGLDADAQFLQMLDEVVRSTAEDDPAGGAGESAETVDEQIKALKRDPKYRAGNVFERRELQEKIDTLYKKKASARR